MDRKAPAMYSEYMYYISNILYYYICKKGYKFYSYDYMECISDQNCIFHVRIDKMKNWGIKCHGMQNC